MFENKLAALDFYAANNFEYQGLILINFFVILNTPKMIIF